MGEASTGRPIENVATSLSDTASGSDGEVVVAPTEAAIISSEDLYHSIKRMRATAAHLGVTAARTGDGLYDNQAHYVLIAAGLMRGILQERGSMYAALLDEEEASEPNQAGVRQLPLR